MASYRIKRIKLTKKATDWKWNMFGEYDYADFDHVIKSGRYKRIEMGLPRYAIHFERIPKNKKRPVFIRLAFNDSAEFEKIDSSGKIPYEELMTYAEQAFTWLIENCYAEEK